MTMTKQEAADLRRDTIERAQSEGLAVAYEAALEICRDPEASKQAKAAAISALFRIGGGFQKHDDLDDVEPHEMTPEQRKRAVARARAALEAEEIMEAGAFD